MKRHALVTGGAGFIGSHLVDRLIMEGWRVRVIDDLTTGNISNLSKVDRKVEFFQGSITDAELVGRAVQGVEVIFHFAAKVFVPESFKIPSQYEHTNVHGTDILLKAARMAGVGRLILSSTSAVYGDAAKLPISEQSLTAPMSPYACNKLAAEELGRKAASDGGIAFTALRYFNVYGLRQDPRSTYSGVISRFAENIGKNIAPTIYGDGLQTRDFINVGDVARANLLAAMSERTGYSVYNVGSGLETSINDLFQRMTLITGSTLVARHELRRHGEVSRSLANIDKIKSELGFAPRVQLKEGLSELLT